jgi:5-oxoprolinase (ATP-hydrolysing)
MAEPGWEFWVDRGGTFTDCIGLAPDGGLHVAKVLSSESSAVEGIRQILEARGALGPGASLPRCHAKLGTTLATNALLERRGARTAWITNEGLADLLTIGTQERPELFELAIEKPPPLQERSLEVSARGAAGGGVLEPFDVEALRPALLGAREDGLHSVAISLIHAHADPGLEEQVAKLARELGFSYVVASHEIAREIGLLARSETTVADAYLTPLLRDHAAALARSLPGSRLRFMQSSGGLTDAAHFRGPAALLSGPAGGVVGAARVAAAAGHPRAIGFDMGGTSTDVSLVVQGEVERAFETVVGGVRVKSPMLRIHTVAAGGGSLCRFDGFRLTVGPESAGADPGPLCYARLDAGGQALAEALTLTDVNLHLGRIQPDRFPFALRAEPVAGALASLRGSLRAAGHDLDLDGIAAGFVEVANASMAQAIQQVSLARGVDPRECVLVGFGGAGGQHVCALARALGMRSVLLHPLAGLLSAYGIGTAPESCDRQRDAGGQRLEPGGRAPARVLELLAELEAEARRTLEQEGVAAAGTVAERRIDLRYVGTESPLAIVEPVDGDFGAAFEREHQQRFGYVREGRALEIVTARARARGPARLPALPIPSAISAREPEPRRTEEVWFPGMGRVPAPIYDRETLAPGHSIAGPAVVLEAAGTIVVDPGFVARVDEDAVLVLVDEAGRDEIAAATDLSRADPVRLEVFGNRFMSIAEQMGAVLRNTSVSTNIKERLDYSCAVFDAEGGLVANAPHIPVHLGAMGETVRRAHELFPDLRRGDVVVTNDPFEGGSHLPDVTVVSPVFVGEREAPGGPRFFVASRGHHADIGGSAPGSMPADSRRLEEEGVVLRPFRLVEGGRLDERRLRAALGAPPHPARNPDDNVADLEAMLAANRAGERLLDELAAEQGLPAVEVTMAQLQQAAAGKVAREIGRLADGEHRFDDALDDGTPVCVRLVVEGERMLVDFAGTGPAVAGNLNAPRAVVQAAVIYVLRALVAERIPLNGGCLAPVRIEVPAGSLLDPPPGSAVVGGNVETSQRVVDVLLGALGRAAASQGTMNNVAFGDDSFGYYETLGGGAGAGPDFAGGSGVHTHMTNTRITDPEILETRYPVRLRRFALRRGSGGSGRFRGGDGLVRAYEFLRPVTVSLLCERRRRAPFGLAGGEPGRPGRNLLRRRDGGERELPGHVSLEVEAGDQLVIETPGGGGYGRLASRVGLESDGE